MLATYEADYRNRPLLCSWDNTTSKFAATREGFLKLFRHDVHDRVFKTDLELLITGPYNEGRRGRI